jgi:hypothetical protein
MIACEGYEVIFERFLRFLAQKDDIKIIYLDKIGMQGYISVGYDYSDE